MTGLSCDIAIIGSGFSGRMAAYHLAQNASAPLKIILIDEAPAPALGAAYETTRPEHLLNVRAAQMSALADAPNHFVDWLQTPHGQAACKNYQVALPVAATDFLPRAVYALYLQSLPQPAQSLHAKATELAVEQDHIAITLDNAQTINAKKLLLATGNAFAPADSDNLITRPWQYDFSQAKNMRNVAVIGSGLTAVDTIISLLESGYKGGIHCISRHAQFPEAHSAQPLAAWSLPSDWEQLKTLPLEGSEALLCEWMNQAPDWRMAIDALRPHLQTIWAAWPVGQRQQFLQEYFGRWNVRRHRMAASIHARLMGALATKQIILHRGDFKGMQNGQPLVEEQSLPPMNITFQCTGPRYSALPPCLDTLLEEGQVERHATQAGLKTISPYRVSKAPIYAVGALLLGEKLETTAVPELRVQAAEVAQAMLAENL